MALGTFAFLLGGMLLLILGAELLVKGASRLASNFGISPLVIGLTVVAYGTSAPELAVSVMAGIHGDPGIAVGNVVGSNIANVLLILGVSALIGPLVVAQQLVRFEVPLMIGVSCLAWAFARNGNVSRLEGAILFAGAVAYTWWAIRKSRNESAEVAKEYEAEFGERTASRPALEVVRVGVGIAVMVGGARALVDGATTLARSLGVTDLVIGLTVVAVGTSLPELATSIVAAVRGERDIAVGNVIGSNLFNILAVLGLSAGLLPSGVPVAEAAIRLDIPIMIVVAAACMPIFFTGFRIDRWEGILFLGYYVAYLAYLWLSATGSASLPSYGKVMSLFVLPLTAITLAIVVIHGSIHRTRHPER
jgi:cation:H+ antiporter